MSANGVKCLRKSGKDRRAEALPLANFRAGAELWLHDPAPLRYAGTGEPSSKSRVPNGRYRARVNSPPGSQDDRTTTTRTRRGRARSGRRAEFVVRASSLRFRSVLRPNKGKMKISVIRETARDGASRNSCNPLAGCQRERAGSPRYLFQWRFRTFIRSAFALLRRDRPHRTKMNKCVITHPPAPRPTEPGCSGSCVGGRPIGRQPGWPHHTLAEIAAAGCARVGGPSLWCGLPAQCRLAASPRKRRLSDQNRPKMKNRQSSEMALRVSQSEIRNSPLATLRGGAR